MSRYDFVKREDSLLVADLMLRLASDPKAGSTAFYALLIAQGYAPEKIILDSSLWGHKYMSDSSMRDAFRIYKWVVHSDFSGMSQINPRDAGNTRSFLRRLDKLASTDAEKSALKFRWNKLLAFEKTLSNFNKSAIVERFSKELLADVPSFPGIYGYSFQIWLDNPDKLSEGAFRVKVGKSEGIGGIRRRILDQVKAGKISMPQPLLPLRAYHFTTSALEAESSIHKELKLLGKHNPDYIRFETGTEWFSTSLKELDEITAATKGFKEKIELWTPSL